MFEKIISKSTPEGSSGSPLPTAQHPAGAGATSPPPPPAAPSSKRNVLGQDVEIQGEVRFEGDLAVGGRVDGKITSKGSLTIEETAHLKAQIACGSVIVRGRVEGDIIASDQVQICAHAVVHGDISANSLAMEAGGIFVGNSNIGQDRATPQVIETPSPSDGTLLEVPDSTEKVSAA